MRKIGGKTVTKDIETPDLTVDQIKVRSIENYGRTRAILSISFIHSGGK